MAEETQASAADLEAVKKLNAAYQHIREELGKVIVGQEHVVKALVHALDESRLHHAYLFTGTRGVGKTTIARIFAKSLNCETGVSSTPCGKCSACEEISEGRFVDLIEVDAASRTKVEDTRELLENVWEMPASITTRAVDQFIRRLRKTFEPNPSEPQFFLTVRDVGYRFVADGEGK